MTADASIAEWKPFSFFHDPVKDEVFRLPAERALPPGCHFCALGKQPRNPDVNGQKVQFKDTDDRGKELQGAVWQTLRKEEVLTYCKEAELMEGVKGRAAQFLKLRGKVIQEFGSRKSRVLSLLFEEHEAGDTASKTLDIKGEDKILKQVRWLPPISAPWPESDEEAERGEAESGEEAAEGDRAAGVEVAIPVRAMKPRGGEEEIPEKADKGAVGKRRKRVAEEEIPKRGGRGRRKRDAIPTFEEID